MAKWTEEQRAKARQRVKETAPQRQVLKLLERVKTVDLRPIDDEIKRMQVRISELTALKRQVEALQGKGPEAGPKLARGPDVGQMLVDYIKVNPGAKAAIIAADIKMPSAVVTQTLNAGNGNLWEQRHNGGWYPKRAEE